MKKIIFGLLVVLFMFSGVAEAKIYKYKYSYTLVANTDGQTPTISYKWNNWKKGWEKNRLINSPMEITEATDVNIIWDTATGACTSTDWDLNLTHSIDGVLYTTTNHYYSIDGETKDIIKSLQGGLTPPMGFILPTIDEDSAGTCTIDVIFGVDRP